MTGLSEYVYMYSLCGCESEWWSMESFTDVNGFLYCCCWTIIKEAMQACVHDLQ